MQIFVWDDLVVPKGPPTGKYMGVTKQSLVVDRSGTIGSLKEQIQREYSLSPQQMKVLMLVIDPRDLSRKRSCPSTLDGGRDILSSTTSTTTIEDSGLKDGDILRVGFNEPFFIQFRSGFCGTLICDIKVNCSDTIRDMRANYYSTYGTYLRDYPLVFRCPGSIDRTLLSYGYFKFLNLTGPQHFIYCNRENVKPPYHRLPLPLLDPDDEKFQIVVKFPDMPFQFPLKCNPTDTIGFVREAIIRKHDSYEQLDDRTFIKKGQFVLVHSGSGTPLEDYSITVEESGIKNIEVFEDNEDAILCIHIYTAPIMLQDTNYPVSVSIKCFETVGRLKMILQTLTSLPVENQLLIYKEWRLENNERRLVDYAIMKPVRYNNPGHTKRAFWGPSDEKFDMVLRSSIESTMAPLTSLKEDHGLSTERPLVGYAVPSLLVKFCRPPEYGETCLAPADKPNRGASNSTQAQTIGWPEVYYSSAREVYNREWLQITIEIANTTWRFPLRFQTGDTIGTVRRSIKFCGRRWPFDQSYIEKGSFVLLFGTKQLEDETATLGEYGIQHTDFIQLFDMTSFAIDVIVPKAKLSPTSVKVVCWETVADLKKKLHALTGILKKDQCVTELHTKWILDDDDRRLLEYGISKQDEASDHDCRILVNASRRKRLYKISFA